MSDAGMEWDGMADLRNTELLVCSLASMIGLAEKHRRWARLRRAQDFGLMRFKWIDFWSLQVAVVSAKVEAELNELPKEEAKVCSSKKLALFQ